MTQCSQIWFSTVRIGKDLHVTHFHLIVISLSSLFTDDVYDNLYDRRLGYNLVKWYWGWFDTDGLAQPMIPGWVGCITIDPNFAVTCNDFPISLAGRIEEWKFVSNDGTLVDLDKTKRLSICMPGGDPENPGINPFPRTDTGGTCKDIGSVEQPICGRCERNPCAQHWICNGYRKLICKFGFEEILLPLLE